MMKRPWYRLINIFMMDWDQSKDLSGVYLDPRLLKDRSLPFISINVKGETQMKVRPRYFNHAIINEVCPYLVHYDWVSR